MNAICPMSDHSTTASKFKLTHYRSSRLNSGRRHADNGCVVFEGRFRVEFWQEAKQAGNRASSHIDYQLCSMGLGRRGWRFFFCRPVRGLRCFCAGLFTAYVQGVLTGG